MISVYFIHIRKDLCWPKIEVYMNIPNAWINLNLSETKTELCRDPGAHPAPSGQAKLFSLVWVWKNLGGWDRTSVRNVTTEDTPTFSLRGCTPSPYSLWLQTFQDQSLPFAVSELKLTESETSLSHAQCCVPAHPREEAAILQPAGFTVALEQLCYLLFPPCPSESSLHHSRSQASVAKSFLLPSRP